MNMTLVTAYSAFSVLFGVFIPLMLYRNQAVFEFRRSCIDEWQKAIETGAAMGDMTIAESAERWFKNLPSYDQMLFRFWVWPVSRFAKESCSDHIQREKEEGMRTAVGMMMMSNPAKK